MLGMNDSSVGTSGTTPNGLHFVYLVENLELGDAKKPVGVFAVALPFATNVHLLGIPKGKELLLDVSARLNIMQPVKLEGDYDDYFSLYTSMNQQIESRVLLNPAAMEYNVDFCAAYTWEIFNNTLYFANQGILPDLKIVDDFVKQLTPAVVTSTGPVLTERPQTIEVLSPVLSKFLCPVCQIALREGRRWLACPAGHGYLLTASEVNTTRQHMNDTGRLAKTTVGAKPAVITPLTIVEHGDLKCPNDAQILTKSIYQETTVYMYICHSCIYRWIDGQYLDTILGKYRNDGEDKDDDDISGDRQDALGNLGGFLMEDVEPRRGWLG